MAVPTNINNIKYKIDHLIRVYDYTPDIYKKMAEALDAQPGAKDYLRKVLTEEWHFEVEDQALDQVSSLLGVKDY